MLQTVADVIAFILQKRSFTPIDTLCYEHPALDAVAARIEKAFEKNEKIALYADYDVDGTMSLTSWIWFLREIRYTNYCFYIPDRKKEGYGVHVSSLQKLFEKEHPQLVLTMDCGITAKKEAHFCKENGVDFICTDHHSILAEKTPNSLILNPLQHENPIYQKLCGCGITFVLLRKLGKSRVLSKDFWSDLMGLCGLATICDIVPLNPVNHALAKKGLACLSRSQRPIIKSLLAACKMEQSISEYDLAFRLGPRINAVGRLEHAHTIIEAFISENPGPLVEKLGTCNEERRAIQKVIVDDARALARLPSSHFFLGGPWHHGVIGIAAAKLLEETQRPVLLYSKEQIPYKGSARSLPGLCLVEALDTAKELFSSYGGHSAAAGFSFMPEHEEQIKIRLAMHFDHLFAKSPHLFQKKSDYDCRLDAHLWNLDLVEALDALRPFGPSFEEPLFFIEGDIAATRILKKSHTQLTLAQAPHIKAMMFGKVLPHNEKDRFCGAVFLRRNTYLGKTSVQMQIAEVF